MHHLETRDHHPRQTVRQVAGEVIGHVPRELADCFSWRLEHGELTMHTMYIGQIIHGGDVRGGGPQLRVAYDIW